MDGPVRFVDTIDNDGLCRSTKLVMLARKEVDCYDRKHGDCKYQEDAYVEEFWD